MERKAGGGWVQLTSEERASYQAMRARGVSHEDALNDALDGVDVDAVRRSGKYNVVVHGVMVAANEDQRRRIEALTPEQRRQFAKIMGGK